MRLKQQNIRLQKQNKNNIVIILYNYTHIYNVIIYIGTFIHIIWFEWNEKFKFPNNNNTQIRQTY